MPDVDPDDRKPPVEDRFRFSERPEAPPSSVDNASKPPEKISDLIDKEQTAERGQGPALSDRDHISLRAWRAFPKPADEQYRDLQERSKLAEKGLGPEISNEEKAKLESKCTFPEQSDGGYRIGLEKRLLHELDKSKPALTPQEDAALDSKFEFPDYGDRSYRNMARREKLGDPPLSDLESSQLNAKRAFPNNEEARALYEKKLNHDKGQGEPLTRDEQQTLNDASPKPNAKAAKREPQELIF